MTQYDPKTFAWWKDALAGKDVPLHADAAHQGYYGYRSSKDAAPVPVALWYSGDELLCKIGDKPHRNGLELWVSVMRNPIPYAVYKDVMAGEPWPTEIRIQLPNGETDSSLAGHNAGTDDDALLGNIEEWTDRARAAVKKGAPTTKQEADTLDDLASKLVELCKDGDDRRDNEARPHFQAHRSVLQKWNDKINPARSVVKDTKMLVGVYQKAEQKRREEAARKLQEEIAAKTAPGDEPPAVEVRVAPVKTGTRGKSTHSVKVDVLDYEEGGFQKAMAFLAENMNERLREAVDRTVFAMLKAGTNVPGAKLIKKETFR